MKLNEEWKEIPGYNGQYLISNYGRVKSLKGSEESLLKLWQHRDGYLLVDLVNKGMRKHHYVHRLVGDRFLGGIPKGMVINHKDENKENNYVENLEICTIAYNNSYGTRPERVANAMSRQLYLFEMDEPWREIKFKSSVEASYYFKYSKTRVGTYIAEARKKRN